MPGKEELPILHLGAPVYAPLWRRRWIFSAPQTSSLPIHFPATVSPSPPPQLHLVLPCMSVSPSGLRQRVRARTRMFRLLWSEEAVLPADTEQTHVLWMRGPPRAATLKGPARCRGGSLTSPSEGEHCRACQTFSGRRGARCGRGPADQSTKGKGRRSCRCRADSFSRRT